MHRFHRFLAGAFAAALLVTAVGAPAAAAEPVASTTSLALDDLGHVPQDNHPLALVATIAPSDVDLATEATVEFVDLDGGVGCAPVAVDPGNATTCRIDDPEPGTHHYQATYSGNATVAGSTSDPLEVTVEVDVVEAASVTIAYGRFFPIKDGYRDALKISGVRLEPASVAIRIYNSNNKRVKLVTRATASGDYAYSWNGRTSAGRLLPAGTYRVVQKLTDTAGISQSFTRSVTLSHKKLVTKTATVTKLGDRIRASHGKLLHNSAGMLRLKAGSGYAAAGWQLSIPSALTYTSLKFQVDARAVLSAPANQISMQNFNTCKRSGYWGSECFNRWKVIGNSTGSRRWYSTKGSVTANRDGRVVRGAIWVMTGVVDVYRVRAVVTYQVLR